MTETADMEANALRACCMIIQTIIILLDLAESFVIPSWPGGAGCGLGTIQQPLRPLPGLKITIIGSLFWKMRNLWSDIFSQIFGTSTENSNRPPSILAGPVVELWLGFQCLCICFSTTRNLNVPGDLGHCRPRLANVEVRFWNCRD